LPHLNCNPILGCPNKGFDVEYLFSVSEKQFNLLTPFFDIMNHRIPPFHFVGLALVCPGFK
jgi:hypothetical protein